MTFHPVSFNHELLQDNLAKIIENAKLGDVASCIVSYLDTEGLRHTVEVEANSMKQPC
jgi:hypothetical protein